MTDHADLRIGRFLILALLVGGTIFLTMLAVQWSLSGPTGLELAARQAAANPAEVRQLLAAQAARLAEYRWLDASAGTVGLPIERAMELVVREQAAAASPRP